MVTVLRAPVFAEARENKRIKRAVKEAKLRIGEASIEGIDYPPRRELDKALVRQLGIGKWIMEHQMVVVTGAKDVAQHVRPCGGRRGEADLSEGEMNGEVDDLLRRQAFDDDADNSESEEDA